MPGDGFCVDVLCVGIGCFDLVFTVDHHPYPDDKCFASSLLSCGGGPAANAAVTAARLGYTSAFAGYLGNDMYGEKHMHEFGQEGVITDLIIRGDKPTPLSAVLVKPDGTRTIVNYGGNMDYLEADAVDFTRCNPKVILFDGHQPHISSRLAEYAKKQSIPLVLDAGSLNAGTRTLSPVVDYLVASGKFARQFTSLTDELSALKRLSDVAPSVVITLGDKGLVWQSKKTAGRLEAFSVDAVDTTGAGDTFHGAFAAGVSAGLPWEELLRYAGAAGALCCTKYGARTGIPTKQELKNFLERTTGKTTEIAG